ncbi:MAG: GspE/PulE family protein [Armatimonadetes bacterium]|nr:GspE/PulE family protein [Armatimonadota bacterium]
MKPIRGHRKLGEILLETDLVSQDQLSQALDVQRNTRQRLGYVLVNMGFVHDELVAAALANQLNLPLIDLTKIEPDPSALASVLSDLAIHHRVFPLKLDGRNLTLVMADPLNVEAEDAIRAATGFNIRPAVAPESQIVECLVKHYSNDAKTYDLLEQVADGEDSDVIAIDEGPTNPSELLAASEFDSVIKAVNAIISDAVKRSASDIHLEPYEQNVRLRYRIDGALRQIAVLPLQAYPAVVSRIKVLANMDISENRKPQDGSFKAIVGHRSTTFRVSSLRTGFGEKVVIRILDNSMKKAGMESLGLLSHDLETLESLLGQTQGLILVTGPTGSGKTTTLYSALNHLKSDEVNIVTVEDPMEYQLSGINQVQVDERAGITFASALRSILRQDPNVVMIGEIRDRETAEIAVRASMTGHLVMATLHTNEAASAPARLEDMGVEPYLLGVSLLGVIAQRLVRRLCAECSESFAKPMGCQHCDFTGYAGRLGLYEILTMDGAVRQAVHRSAGKDEIEELARKYGFRTMADDAQAKIEMGWTTQEQVQAVLGKSSATPPTTPRLEAASKPALPPKELPVEYPEEEAHPLDRLNGAHHASNGNGNGNGYSSPSAGENGSNGFIGVHATGANGSSYPVALQPTSYIQAQIDRDQIRLIAIHGVEILAAHTYQGGWRKWQEKMGAEMGMSADKMAPLLQAFAMSGGSPFQDSLKRLVGPLVKVMQSTRTQFAGRESNTVPILLRWDSGQLPGLLEAIQACDPTLQVEVVQESGSAVMADAPLPFAMAQ